MSPEHSALKGPPTNTMTKKKTVFVSQLKLKYILSLV